MKSIGIKLADGSFYPLLEEGNPEKKALDLTTVMDNQTKVQVEVYRTETGTLENAEYIDTLEIKNLKPHENGEPTLCLAIDVDENNELSAEIRDPETGKKSEIQVTLQSRTLAGLNAKSKGELDDVDDGVTISDNDLEKAGLDDFVEKPEFDSKEIPLPSEDFSFDDVNEPVHEEEKNDAPEIENTDAAESDADEIFGDNSLDLPEFGTDETATIIEEDVVEPEEEKNNQENQILQDDDEEPEVDEMIDDEDFEEPVIEDAETEISEPQNALEEPEENFKNDDILDEDFATEDTVTEEVPDESNGNEDFSASLPDFDDSIFDDDAATETQASDDSADELELPDFDGLEATDIDTIMNTDAEDESDSNDKDFSEFDLPEFSTDEPEDKSLTDDDEDFTLPPDFDIKSSGDAELHSDEQPKNPTFAPSNSMFSNLYDKETLEGTSGSYDFEEEKEKAGNSKVPMIICIICAVICVVAALLTLFVIPSRLNVFSKSEKNDAVITETAEDEPEENSDTTEAEIPEEKEIKETEEISPAKEDTIVIAETPAAVIPAEPEPSPEPIPDIRYKIVWGDTLWDISTAYYKTPWKYKKIARYNKIRNPDHIISGTYILIPAE